VSLGLGGAIVKLKAIKVSRIRIFNNKE